MLNLWHRNFRWVDPIIVVTVTAGFGVWLFRFGGHADVAAILAGNRAAVYGTLASIEGSLLGFVIAAVAIVIGYVDSGRLAFLEDSETLHQLWRVFLDDIWWLSLATITSVSALILERGSQPGASLVVVGVVFATLMAAVSVGRSIWVLERIVTAVTEQRRKGRSPEIPGAGPSKLPVSGGS